MGRSEGWGRVETSQSRGHVAGRVRGVQPAERRALLGRGKGTCTGAGPVEPGRPEERDHSLHLQHEAGWGQGGAAVLGTGALSLPEPVCVFTPPSPSLKPSSTVIFLEAGPAWRP